MWLKNAFLLIADFRDFWPSFKLKRYMNDNLESELEDEEIPNSLARMI